MCARARAIRGRSQSERTARRLGREPRADGTCVTAANDLVCVMCVCVCARMSEQLDGRVSFERGDQDTGNVIDAAHLPNPQIRE